MAGTRLRPSSEVVYQSLHGEVVLVHLRTNRIYALNTTGGRLWELLAEGCDHAELERRLLAEFDVDPAQLRQEVGELLASLVTEGLVVEAES
jgi:hypothetical protein